MTGNKRFRPLAERDINKETLVQPWPEAGVVATDSPFDPPPSLSIDHAQRQVIELDGKRRADFDALDYFIADHAINLDVAEQAMATPSRDIARMLADINAPGAAIRRLVTGCTPAKLCDV